MHNGSSNEECNVAATFSISCSRAVIPRVAARGVLEVPEFASVVRMQTAAVGPIAHTVMILVLAAAPLVGHVHVEGSAVRRAGRVGVVVVVLSATIFTFPELIA